MIQLPIYKHNYKNKNNKYKNLKKTQKISKIK